MTLIELIATVCGVICVYLTIRQSVWCWPVGLVQVTLFVWVFYRAKLYSDVILHIVYIGLGVYGWYHWLRGGSSRRLAAGTVLPITRIGAASGAAWLLAAAAATTGWGHLMRRYTDASLPFWDAAIAVLSLVAQFLLGRKVLENWLFWIAVDVLAVGVYAAKELYLTAGLYGLFLVMAVLGWLQWRKSFRLQATGLGDSAPAPGSSSENSFRLTAGTSS